MSASAYGYQAGSRPAEGGDVSTVTAVPAGCAVADWVDEPPSIQCTALKTNGEQCSAHKVSNSPFCVGHIRGWRKQNEKADG